MNFLLNYTIMRKHISLLLLFAIFILGEGIGYSQSNPYDADIVVAADGSGDFSSLQPAIDAVPSNEETRTVIYIKRGLYNTEKLFIPSDKKNITLIGESRDETILSYHIYDCSSGKCPTEDAALWTGDNIVTSATLTIMGEGFRAENLTIENTAGPVGQALAITVRADKIVFINVNFTSYQDTLYLWHSGIRIYFENCLVVGRTDYIYGASIAFFQACEIRSWGGGWITAPSTPQDQDYGFVFNECDITYALNSPRAGDDGNLVRFGRPWHEYPKVAWLYCDMTEKIHPEGWGDTWNMNYAASSADLHLYEYANTGPGADMSGRADWEGLRALSAGEAADYTVQMVMAGDDAWDPSAEASAVTIYEWTGGAASTGWLEKDNWNPIDTPMIGESAYVDGDFTLTADGNPFDADLNLINGATLDIDASSGFTFMTAGKSTIATSQDVSLTGKIKTKDTLYFDIVGNLNLDAEILGVHKIIKTGSGLLNLNTANQGYTGEWIVKEGSLNAAVDGALGSAGVIIDAGATLSVGNNNAFFPQSPLSVSSSSILMMNADIVISEFFIDDVIQPIGEYSSSSNPGLITGSGKIIVGRPSSFTFIGGDNGNWDNPAHFQPALLPEAGETVYCNKEIETTSTVFTANLYIQTGGTVRLRGVHTCTGEIHFADNTSISYSTSGSGFTLNAPIFVDGELSLRMSSGNASGCEMKLGGPISGSETVNVWNYGRSEPINTGTVRLGGDNSAFDGEWNITLESSYGPDYVSALEANSAHALGQGKVVVGKINKLILNHAFCAGNKLDVSIQDAGMIVLNQDVTVKEFFLNDVQQADGVYSASTNSNVFEGGGSLTVDSGLALPSAPSGLIATEVLHDQVTVEWTGSTDTGVEYIVLQDGTKEETVTESTATITGLDAETTYSIGVCASNVLGNSDTIYIDVTTPMEVGVDFQESREYTLSPNPVTDILYIQGARMENWQIISLKGQVLKYGIEPEVDASSLEPGIYFLKMHLAENGNIYHRFIKASE